MAFDGSGNAGNTLTSASAYLKNWYINKGMLNTLMYERDPFLMRIKRLPAAQQVGGKKLIVPFRLGRSPSQSKDFTKAQAQAKARTGARATWELDIDHDFGLSRVNNQTIKASRNDRGAFIKVLKDEADLAISSLAQKRCVSLFAEKANVAGYVSARAASTITLSRDSQSVAFDINDTIEVRSPTGVVRAGGPWVIEKVNRGTGVLTLDKPAGSAVAANDEIYKDGDYGQTALVGLPQWLPKSRTGLTTFNGVDRSLDPERTAGFFKKMGASDTFDKVVRSVAAQINWLTGTNPTIAVMNPLVEDVVSQELTDKIRYDDAGKGAAGKVGVGIGGLSFKTSKGPIEVVSSSFCPTTDIYLLDESSIGLYYLPGDGNNFVDFEYSTSGSMFVDAYDSSGVEIRCSSYGNLGVSHPGTCGRIELDTSKIPSIG